MGYNLRLTAFDNEDTQRVCTVRLTTELIPSRAGTRIQLTSNLDVLPDKIRRCCEVPCVPSCHNEQHSFAWLALAL